MSGVENTPQQKSSPRFDPRSVAIVLVVVIGGLALLFPKPDKAPAAPIDPISVPRGFDLHSVAEPDISRCTRGEQVKEDCALLGISESESISLTMTWEAPLGEDLKPGTPVEVSGARLLLIENHQDDYQGPMMLEGRFPGVRIDSRTFRFPADGADPAFDALLSERLSGGALTLSVAPTAEAPSSIDEFTPSLAFGWRVAQ